MKLVQESAISIKEARIKQRDAKLANDPENPLLHSDYVEPTPAEILAGKPRPDRKHICHAQAILKLTALTDLTEAYVPQIVTSRPVQLLTGVTTNVTLV